MRGLNHLVQGSMADIRSYRPDQVKMTFNGIEMIGFIDDPFIVESLEPVALKDRRAIEEPHVDADGVAHYFLARLAQIDPFHFVQEPGCINPDTGQDLGAQWPAGVIVRRAALDDPRVARDTPIMNGRLLPHQHENLARRKPDWRWQSAMERGIAIHRQIEAESAFELQYAQPVFHEFISHRSLADAAEQYIHVRLPMTSGVFGPTSAALWAVAC